MLFSLREPFMGIISTVISPGVVVTKSHEPPSTYAAHAFVEDGRSQWLGR